MKIELKKSRWDYFKIQHTVIPNTLPIRFDFKEHQREGLFSVFMETMVWTPPTWRSKIALWIFKELSITKRSLSYIYEDSLDRIELQQALNKITETISLNRLGRLQT